MPDRQTDYARTDELDDALIPIEMLREKLGVSTRTMARRLGNATRHRYNGGYAVKWGDVSHLFTGAPKVAQQT